MKAEVPLSSRFSPPASSGGSFSRPTITFHHWEFHSPHQCSPFGPTCCKSFLLVPVFILRVKIKKVLTSFLGQELLGHLSFCPAEILCQKRLSGKGWTQQAGKAFVKGFNRAVWPNTSKFSMERKLTRRTVKTSPYVTNVHELSLQRTMLQLIFRLSKKRESQALYNFFEFNFILTAEVE